VRQLVDTDGTIKLAKGYEPYGDVFSSAGVGASLYGFTGEMQGNGLVYLRSRYYAPYLNQFIQADPIVPDPHQPWEWNRYTYARNNPINLTDPAGTDPIDDIAKALHDETEDCYNKRDLSCVWRNYFALAVGGSILGYNHASDHLFQFLFKRGNINYVPVPQNYINRSSYWVLSTNAVQTELPARELEILSLIHNEAKSGNRKGYFETSHKSVYVPNKTIDRDLYYAMNIFALWAEVDYEISGCNEVTVKPTYRFSDSYNWHTGLAAGGPAIAVTGFLDEWTAALHDAGMALEYEISGYWFGPNKVYTFPTNWLDLDIPLPPVSERAAPER
jgi:RHS repeat-associated protein